MFMDMDRAKHILETRMPEVIQAITFISNVAKSDTVSSFAIAIDAVNELAKRLDTRIDAKDQTLDYILKSNEHLLEITELLDQRITQLSSRLTVIEAKRPE